ncbi:IclR family transcriptional regulator C-terminal domain-containing protein, partial [Embleya sp. NPDC059259]
MPRPDYEDAAVGVVCVAAPVLGPDDEPVAAIGVAGPSPRFRPEAHVTALRAAASSRVGTHCPDRYAR